MLLSGMTAKGNLHLHAVAERSHRERVSLVWAQKYPTASRPRGLPWLSALWGMLCALQSSRILPVLKVNSTTWSHPSLNSHLDSLLGPQRRYHRGSLDVWRSNTVGQHCKRGNTLQPTCLRWWDSVWEQTPNLNPWAVRGNPTCTGWPHWQWQGKNFQLQKNHWTS